MMRFRIFAVALTVVTLGAAGAVQRAVAQSDSRLTSPTGAVDQQLELTASQRSAIYAAVSKDKSKTAPRPFSTAVGADVPPMIELYALPEDAVAGNATAKFYKYTMVQDEVVVVDPTRMRVVDTIGPTPQQPAPELSPPRR